MKYYYLGLVALTFFLGLSASLLNFPSLIAASDSYRIAIIGDGHVEGRVGEPDGIDPKNFGLILSSVKKANPDMVFFVGNLIGGLEQVTTIQAFSEFENRLNEFSSLVKTYLGTDIPVYPVMGNHTLVNTQAVEIFRNHFNIQQSPWLPSYQLAYEVDLGDSQFVVLATGIFEPKYQGYTDEKTKLSIFDWLIRELKFKPRYFKNRFVIGHYPVFPSSRSQDLLVYNGEGEGFKSTQNDRIQENKFWSILKNGGVLVYFCSHEPVYDRSNHDGVWQVMTGGMGAAAVSEMIGKANESESESEKIEKNIVNLDKELNNGKEEGRNLSFRHFVLLEVPKNGSEKSERKVETTQDGKGAVIWAGKGGEKEAGKRSEKEVGKGNVIIRAIDDNGYVWDQFNLDNVERPVHQLRIY